MGITSGVVVGRVVEVKPHPNADRIRLARVDLGLGEPVQIVFGGPPNVHTGDLVPVAPPGSRLPGPDKIYKIRRRRYRGESSHGMLCSLAELGWSLDAPDEVTLLRNVAPGDSLDKMTGTDWQSLVINTTSTFDFDAVHEAQSLPRMVQENVMVAIRNTVGPTTQGRLAEITRSQPRDTNSATGNSDPAEVPNAYHGIGVERVSCPSTRRMAAEVAGKAFQHDPMWRHILPDSGHRTRVLPAVLPLDYAQRYGQVWVTSPHVYGVACWLPPSNKVMTYWRLLRVGALQRTLHLGLAAFGRFLRLEGSLEEQHCRDAAQPHWYLLLLAVDPPSQGCGLGGQLMAPVLQKADAVGMPVYLQTLHERNVPFYERHGFRVTSETVPNRGEPPCWGMIRP